MKEPLGLGLVGAGAFGAFCLDAYAAMDAVMVVARASNKCCQKRPDQVH